MAGAVPFALAAGVMLVSHVSRAGVVIVYLSSKTNLIVDRWVAASADSMLDFCVKLPRVRPF